MPGVRTERRWTPTRPVPPVRRPGTELTHTVLKRGLDSCFDALLPWRAMPRQHGVRVQRPKLGQRGKRLPAVVRPGTCDDPRPCEAGVRVERHECVTGEQDAPIPEQE